MNPCISQLRKLLPLYLGVFALGCLVPKAQAVEPAAPDTALAGGNTADGQLALANVDNGIYNTAVGIYSLFSLTNGNYNTANGAGALFSLTFESENTATGAGALFSYSPSDLEGVGNTADGAFALFSNATGGGNTAVGNRALVSNIDGGRNTAVGAHALVSHTTGQSSSAFGFDALRDDKDGDANSAFGDGALATNQHATKNVAVGFAALSFSDFTGSGLASDNVAVGTHAMGTNTDGASNTAVGTSALLENDTGGNNTAVGANALNLSTTGNQNVALGAEAGTAVQTANNVICVGANIAGADVSDTTWIGNVFGVTTQSGTAAPVIVSDTGQLGTIASSERFKKDISTMEKTSEAILALRPVTFHYKTDAKVTPQFGLIAEEVAKVNPALVVRDKKGKPFTVRYDAVNAMLLNEFLKEHKAFISQQHAMEQQQATITRLEKQVEALTAGLQKVSAQLEVSKTAPQTVLNNQ